jgi:RimJ/RimL family protein N-acetyltransferase
VNLDCGQCTVRDWRTTDKPSLLRHANNRNVWRNLTHRFPHPYTEADADDWLSLAANAPNATAWCIDVGGEAVGGIGLRVGEGVYAKTAEFGYWLAEPFWGRGIMTAAVQATSEYALDQFDLVRLESPVFEWNPSSMRVLEKCGFVREAVLRKSIFKDGQIIDAVSYVLLR